MVRCIDPRQPTTDKLDLPPPSFPVGFHFDAIAAATPSWTASEPLKGTYRLNQIILSTYTPDGPSAPFIFRFALADTTPTSLAEMDAAEDITPNLDKGATNRPSLRIIHTAGFTQLCLSLPINPEGRRLITELTHTNAVACDAEVVLVLTRTD